MRKKGIFKWIVGGFIIVVAVASLSLLKLGDHMVYFYTPAEAIAQASSLDGKLIRIGAMVGVGSIEKKTAPIEVKFMATDLKGSDFNVIYKGVPPDMFKEGQGVVVEGRWQGPQVFLAQNLFVKHSEEYKKPEDHQKINAEYLQKSILKNESDNR